MPKLSLSATNIDALFDAVSSDSIVSVQIFLLKLSSDREMLFNALNKSHPVNKLTVLQWAVKNYPRTSLKMIKILLNFGASTEVEATDTNDYDDDYCDLNGQAPLWIALQKKGNDKETFGLVKLLLAYKADIYFRYNGVPFTDCLDEKEIIGSQVIGDKTEGYSLLHLSVKSEADLEVMKLLISAGSKLLLNDHQNCRKETPLIFSCRNGDFIRTKLILESGANVQHKDFEELGAYERAAIEYNAEICHFLERFSLNNNEFYNYNDNIFSIICKFHVNDAFVLEIVKKNENLNWCGVWSHQITLPELGESTELLPVDGFWEWIGEWKNSKIRDFKIHNIMSPNSIEVMCRLRKLSIVNEPFYLKEAIDLIKRASIFVELEPETKLHSKSSTWQLYQKALAILLEGLQRETDLKMKSQAASYFQRLLQYAEIISENFDETSERLLDTLSTSSSNLTLSRSSLDLNEANPSRENLLVNVQPQVTKDFPIKEVNIGQGHYYHANNFNRSSKDFESGEDSDDSLIYCPACSFKFPNGRDRINHLKTCLRSPVNKIVGDRYTFSTETKSNNNNNNNYYNYNDDYYSSLHTEECPICYEQLDSRYYDDTNNTDRIVIMNCLCRYHEKCIKEWIKRGNQCPFHSL